jgi:hypothetical protein
VCVCVCQRERGIADWAVAFVGRMMIGVLMVALYKRQNSNKYNFLHTYIHTHTHTHTYSHIISVHFISYLIFQCLYASPKTAELF